MSSISGVRSRDLRHEGVVPQAQRLGRLVDGRLVWLCVALLSVDLVFVAVHAAHTVYASLYTDRTPILGWRWDIAYDRSYLEMFGYLKILLIIGALMAMPAGKERLVYLIFAVIFSIALLDDSLQIHEVLGQRIADALALRPFAGLRPVDFGELLVWAGVGVLVSGLAAMALLRTSGRDRANGLLLLGALGVLVVFAVGVDMVHVVVEQAFRGSGLLFTVIEEGGQQMTLSLSCSLAVLILREVASREPARSG